jgi:hypothetical protein
MRVDDVAENKPGINLSQHIIGRCSSHQTKANIARQRLNGPTFHTDMEVSTQNTSRTARNSSPKHTFIRRSTDGYRFCSSG